MARRRIPKWSDGKRKALTDAELTSVTDQVELLRTQMLAHCVGEFTNENYFDLFIPDALKQSFKDVFLHGEWQRWPVDFKIEWTPIETKPQVKVTIRKQSSLNRPILMQHMMLQTTAPAELVERVTSLVTERIIIGTDYCRVDAVVRALNKHCDTPSQMRFFLPQIVALAEKAGLATLCEKMKGNPRELSALPMCVRTACKSAAITLTQAQLLADATSPERNTALLFELVPFKVNEGGFIFDVKA